MRNTFLLYLAVLVLTGCSPMKKLASTPPLGWNSYTGYSTVAPESELIKNIDAVAEKLKPWGSLETTFNRWEAMQDYKGAENNSWLDMDMICFGRLYVVENGGWISKFTDDQKRTFML